MPINNISQIISTIPEAGRRGIDVQTVFVNKQEDFQDHLQGTTVTELNTLKTQMNTMAGEMNTTASQVNTDATTASTKASEASASATTASTKASEASASASNALASRNQAEIFAQQAQASATSIDVNNIVHRTGDESIAGVKTFSSTIVGSISGNSATATKLTTARTIGGVSFDGSAGINLPGVNTAGNQNTSGNSATATKLATARTINGVNFDGTADITVVDSTKAPLASPALTGTPTAPTAAVGTNTTQIATTAFVLANSLQDVSFTAGTKVEAIAASEVIVNSITYTKKKEISVCKGGTITVSFRLKAEESYAYGQIYVNGVAVGTVRATTSTAYVTYTQGITVAAGDLVQLYIKCGNAGYAAFADQFKILVATPNTSSVLLN